MREQKEWPEIKDTPERLDTVKFVCKMLIIRQTSHRIDKKKKREDKNNNINTKGI